MEESSRKQSSFQQKQVSLGVSGGIAAYKSLEIVRGLQRAGCNVRVAMTKHACKFIRPLSFRALSGNEVIVDDFAPENPDAMSHISFSQDAHLLLIAPATANTIARFAQGLAGDFLSTTYLACKAPVLIAPAMNTAMWRHPATIRNVNQLRRDGVMILEPDWGEMACGTIGPGRLNQPEVIVDSALAILNQGRLPEPRAAESAESRGKDLSGEHILITAGATREHIDPVRFISNRSSGRMGFALGRRALNRGADVTIVAGTTTSPEPVGALLLRAGSAEEMQRVVMEHIDRATVFISVAAVCDYRPVSRSDTKIKKSRGEWQLDLTPTPDVLADVAVRRRNGLVLVGFAAETEDAIANAREKMHRKNVDVMVANDITIEGAGFDTKTNVITVLTSYDGYRELSFPLMSKEEAADKILDEVVRFRKRRHAQKEVDGE